MASASASLERLMQQAAECKSKAQWELAENWLRDAESLCNQPGFPSAAQNQIRVQLELAEVARRHGKYRDAIEAQERVVGSRDVDLMRKCKVYGELGVNYRHMNRITEAAETFQRHHDLAVRLAFEMDAEACRAVGNLAMSKYQLYMQPLQQKDADLLLQSIRLLEGRVTTAQSLRTRLQEDFARDQAQQQRMTLVGADKSWVDSWIARLYMWEAIGISRLVLSYMADQQLAKAVQAGERAVEMTKDAPWADPTVRALSRFMFGHALLHDDRVDEARAQFSFPKVVLPGAAGICTPAIALCKEPSAEHTQYLQEVIEANVDLTAYDEQGYSALDYAVYGNDPDAINLLRMGLNAQIGLDRSENALKVARIRRHFREISHGQFRPIIQGETPDCVQALRSKYAELLREQEGKREHFDWLRAVSYHDFVQQQALPRWDMNNAQLTREFGRNEGIGTTEPFVVFFSYRWIGRDTDPHCRTPDNAENHQYKRMLDALEQLLERNPSVRKDNVYIWLDCACIYQEDTEIDRKERGINALPMIIAQCDAVISIVDEQYHERAWCAVEVMIVQTLIESSRYHHWYEHVLLDKSPGKPQGLLQDVLSRRRPESQPSSFRVSVESDRQYIRFLERQSMLLGKAASKS